ncbi:MAG TPA: aminopeptidase P N-terminal domain-containing protein [Oligoflexia bacterium]|nr:aminopeptidase P N-terminal domain-containing protein [Oligoflexia bacterium]HMP26543.1 aminopeptidase P N-terminal domain-containing protein [Oligoflexia bacterium]
MEKIAKNRIKKLIDSLNKNSECASLLISAAEAPFRSHDQLYPFRQNSDFFYFTLCGNSRGVHLLLRSDYKRPLLFCEKQDAENRVWEGRLHDGKKIASLIGAELIETNKLETEIFAAIRGYSTFYFQSDQSTLSFRIMRRLSEMRAFEAERLLGYPRKLISASLVISPLRMIKDAHEVEAIKTSIKLTNQAIREAAREIAVGISEFQIRAILDFFFALHNGVPAFATIVASGGSAATLHHRTSAQLIKRNDFVLIDCGCELNGYASDISRTFPAAKRFEKWQRLLYLGVLRAQMEAIKKIRAGVKIRTIYLAAVEVLTETLLELRVIKGRLAYLIKSEAFKPFFPHGIGHLLGIDVHDVGQMRGNLDFILQKDMVITIEPGLYFSKPIGLVLAGGVRIEDNILVGAKGAEILSSNIPKTIEEVEAFLLN